MKNCCRRCSNSTTTATANSYAAGCQGPLLCSDQVERALAGIKIHCRRRGVVERRLHFGAVGGMPPAAVLAVLDCVRLEATATAILKAASLAPRFLAASIGIAAQSRPARHSKRESRRTGSAVRRTRHRQRRLRARPLRLPQFRQAQRHRRPSPSCSPTRRSVVDPPSSSSSPSSHSPRAYTAWDTPGRGLVFS